MFKDLCHHARKTGPVSAMRGFGVKLTEDVRAEVVDDHQCLTVHICGHASGGYRNRSRVNQLPKVRSKTFGTET